MPALSGEVIYLYAFDVAHEMRREPVRRLLGREVEQMVIGPHKGIPRQQSFHRPQMVRLPPTERRGPHGQATVATTIKLMPLGAITITMRVPFAVGQLGDLVAYHDLHLDGMSMHDLARDLAERVRHELQPFYIRPVERLEDEEAYTVFCLGGAAIAEVEAEHWLADNRRAVAGLLTQEADPASLSQREVEESTAQALSYYRRDLVVVDWDSALVIDEQPLPDELLYIIELANLQLTELEAYDRILDAAVDRAYRDVGGRRPGRKVVHQLGEIRIELSRLSDELSNITKFFGDWHLARIYASLAGRFHLADWHRTIDDKLKTLDGIYQVLTHEQNNRLMVTLESVVVILFVIDLVMIGAELLLRR